MNGLLEKLFNRSHLQSGEIGDKEDIPKYEDLKAEFEGGIFIYHISGRYWTQNQEGDGTFGCRVSAVEPISHDTDWFRLNCFLAYKLHRNKPKDGTTRTVVITGLIPLSGFARVHFSGVVTFWDPPPKEQWESLEREFDQEYAEACEIWLGGDYAYLVTYEYVDCLADDRPLPLNLVVHPHELIDESTDISKLQRFCLLSWGMDTNSKLGSLVEATIINVVAFNQKTRRAELGLE